MKISWLPSAMSEAALASPSKLPGVLAFELKAIQRPLLLRLGLLLLTSTRILLKSVSGLVGLSAGFAGLTRALVVFVIWKMRRCA
jgi:hypothetical protein